MSLYGLGSCRHEEVHATAVEKAAIRLQTPSIPLMIKHVASLHPAPFEDDVLPDG
jgi:hypothetical protein